MAQFTEANGRAPTSDDLVKIMSSKANLPGVTSRDHFKIEALARSIAAGGVRQPPILASDGTLLDGNRRVTACLYVLGGGEFSSEQKARAGKIRAWQLTEHATEAEKEAVVVSLNFESDCKEPWPEHIKGEIIYEEWRQILERELALTVARERDLKRELAARFAITVDRCNRYIEMVKLANEFEDYHRLEHGKDEHEVLHRVSEHFQYFDELGKGRGSGGVNWSLNQDDVFKGLVFDLLYDGKFRNWSQIRDLKHAYQNDECLDLLASARSTPDVKLGRQRVHEALSLGNTVRALERKLHGNQRIEGFVKWLREAPVEFFSVGEPGAVTESNLWGLFTALRLVEGHIPEAWKNGPTGTHQRTPPGREIELFSFDVAMSEDFGSVLFRVRGGAKEVEAVKALGGLLPAGTDLRRSPEGVRVRPSDAQCLLMPRPDINVHWTDTARRFVENRRAAQAAYPLVRDDLRALLEGGLEVARRAVSDSAGLDVLDAHQTVNVAAMTLRRGFGLCLFDEQGAGKTVSLIYTYDLLAARGYADQIVIVAPKSMVPEWPKDFRSFRPGLYQVVTVTGSSKDKRAALRSGADVYATNFETVVAMEPYFETLLRSRPDRTVLVVDESFFIKSPDAKRTRSLRRLREWCRWAFVLCGTPAPNAPHDLVEQFNLVDFGLTFEGSSIPVDRHEAIPIVRRIVEERGLYIRHLKSEVLPDLPARAFHRLFVAMTPCQARSYEALRDGLVADLRAVSEAQFRKDYASYLARRSALLQVCSNPVSVVEGYAETPAKLLLLDEILDRWIRRRNEKVVVWSFYTASIDAIVARYAPLGVVRYDGSVSDVAEPGRSRTALSGGRHRAVVRGEPGGGRCRADVAPRQSRSLRVDVEPSRTLPPEP